VLVITGPTASGKSSLGLEVAERVGGEIVSADAFAVYRGMDIGTDKPDREARRRVPHHLIDILEPVEPFSAGAFAASADTAIAAIAASGHAPLIVGGSLFYIDALLFSLFPSPPPDPELRARLRDAWDRDPDGLFSRLEKIDPMAAGRIGRSDRQRIVRALEVYETTLEPISAHWERHQRQTRYNALLVAPERGRDDLYARINSRVERMFSAGLIDEVACILSSGTPWEAHALKAIGYREVVEFLRGRADLETTIENTKSATRRFAKRQLSWLRNQREGYLNWVSPTEEGGAAQVEALLSDHFAAAMSGEAEGR
jgi:tRNA dimethylallyltransferase